MMIELMKLFVCAVLVFGVVKSGPSPYANNYPYNSYAYSGEDAGGRNDMYMKNQISDKGNDLKSELDVSKFYNSDNVSNGHDMNNERYGASTDTKKHTIGEDSNNDTSHNRKHIKSGFRNSYHKDESGSNSSFYEDSDDHGGKLMYNKKHHHGGDAYDSRFNDRVRDGANRDKYDDRYGGYDSRGSHDREHYVAENHDNERDHRDAYNRGHDERYGGYGGTTRSDRYAPRDNYRPYRPADEQQYFRPPIPSYRNDYPRPLPAPSTTLSDLNKPLDDDYVSRHRITIYEDPRDLIDPRNDRRGDYRSQPPPPLPPPILDIRPSPMRYSSFDDERRDGLRYRGGY